MGCCFSSSEGDGEFAEPLLKPAPFAQSQSQSTSSQYGTADLSLPPPPPVLPPPLPPAPKPPKIVKPKVNVKVNESATEKPTEMGGGGAEQGGQEDEVVERDLASKRSSAVESGLAPEVPPPPTPVSPTDAFEALREKYAREVVEDELEGNGRDSLIEKEVNERDHLRHYLQKTKTKKDINQIEAEEEEKRKQAEEEKKKREEAKRTWKGGIFKVKGYLAFKNDHETIREEAERKKKAEEEKKRKLDEKLKKKERSAMRRVSAAFGFGRGSKKEKGGNIGEESVESRNGDSLGTKITGIPQPPKSPS